MEVFYIRGQRALASKRKIPILFCDQSQRRAAQRLLKALDKGSVMPTASNEVKTGQLFCEWFSAKNAAEKKAFMKKLGQGALQLVGRNDADDLVQETMAALWTSPHLYEDIGIWLAFAKAGEIAPRFWKRRTQEEITDADDVVDPGNNQLEAMVRREAEREAAQASESAVERMREALSATQNKFVDFNLEVERNLPSDDAKGPFHSGPKRMQFDNIEIARQQLPAEIRNELKHIEQRLGEIKKIEGDLTEAVTAEAALLAQRLAEIAGIIKPLVTRIEAEAENLRKKLWRRGYSSSADLMKRPEQTSHAPKGRASGRRASPRQRLNA